MACDMFGVLRFVTLYINNVIICSKFLEDHLEHIGILFERIRQASLKRKLEKCSLEVPEEKILGQVVSKEGVATDPPKIERIKRSEGFSQEENCIHS